MNKEDCLTGLTLYKGNMSESVVLAAYVRAGFLVSLPFGGGAAYDLVVDTGARLVRVQVKTGKFDSGCVLYNVRRHRGSRYNAFSRYHADELDVFAIWCPDNEQLYAVPVEHSLTVEGRLRLAETLNLQAKKIKWAHVFAWEAHITALRSERAATAPAYARA